MLRVMSKDMLLAESFQRSFCHLMLENYQYSFDDADYYLKIQVENNKTLRLSLRKICYEKMEKYQTNSIKID